MSVESATNPLNIRVLGIGLPCFLRLAATEVYDSPPCFGSRRPESCYAEAALSALHIDAWLGPIPVVKTALVAAKAIGSVRDHLLLRKIAVYLHAISAIPAAERRAMVEGRS